MNPELGEQSRFEIEIEIKVLWAQLERRCKWREGGSSGPLRIPEICEQERKSSQ